MTGAWITPEGQIHWTSNADGHSEVIKELGIKDDLTTQAAKMHWSEHEKQMHFDKDLAYIAMKLGYIRVICFLSQIGIESGIDCNEFTKKQIDSIYEIVGRYSNSKAHVMFELFQQGKSKQFDDVTEFAKCLNMNGSNDELYN